MAFRIVRQDITKMNTQAIVNTASAQVSVGSGCDSAVYAAAGYDKLLSYRKEKIGEAKEGEAFITPGFDLPAEYIIHVVSPLYTGGDNGEEEKLRDCYRNSLKLAKEHGITSMAIPLIATGNFGYPKEEGMRIAVDEISAFLFENEMQVALVVFDEKATNLGGKLYPNLESYIDSHYVEDRQMEEYGAAIPDRTDRGNGRPVQTGEAAFGAAMASQCMAPMPAGAAMPMMAAKSSKPVTMPSVSASMPSKPGKRRKSPKTEGMLSSIFKSKNSAKLSAAKESVCMSEEGQPLDDAVMSFDEADMDLKETVMKRKETGVVFADAALLSDTLSLTIAEDDDEFDEGYEDEYEESVSADFDEEHESRLEERMNHVSDTFS
ncbi:MAG: macro domain-containing protein, partial [Lachnospiraceae bacterium]|nr:macro domain-containing protein [Lachnospiraceae bacterium]